MHPNIRRLRNVVLPAVPAVLVAPLANAQIVYTSANVTLAFSDSKFLFVDMGTGGQPGAAALGPQNQSLSTVSSPSFYLFFRYNSGRPEWVSNNQTTFSGNNQVSHASVGNYVGLLALGAPINNLLSLQGNYTPFRVSGANGTVWTPGTSGFIGVKFDTTTSPLFGWVQVSYNADQSISVIDFAYEASGGAILAGAVPEPSTSSLLVTGLLAGSAALYLRRRKSAA